MSLGQSIKGRRLRAANARADGTAIRCYANEAIAKWQIVCVVGASGKYPKVEKASSLVAADASGVLMVAMHAAASGRYLQCRPIGTIERQATNGLAVGDPIYLGATGGGWSSSISGFNRQIGTVLVVSATLGVIFFSGTAVASPRFVTGSGTIDAAATTLTITAATLGGVYGGSRVWVSPRETATNSVFLRSATWSGNDLVVEASGLPGASNLDFDYMIRVA